MPALPKELSRAVYVRDGLKCRHCRERGGLHPHHVIYQSHGGPDEMNNLITLCAQCHRAHHDGFLQIEIVETQENNIIVRFTRLKGWKPQ